MKNPFAIRTILFRSGERFPLLVPLNLANAYANLLPQSEVQATLPSAHAIADYHWTEFGKYGLPTSTCGGTPFGKTFDVVPRGLWCTLCVR